MGVATPTSKGCEEEEEFQVSLVTAAHVQGPEVLSLGVCPAHSPGWVCKGYQGLQRGPRHHPKPSSDEEDRPSLWGPSLGNGNPEGR